MSFSVVVNSSKNTCVDRGGGCTGIKWDSTINIAGTRVFTDSIRY